MIILPYRKPCINAQINKEGDINQTKLILNNLLKYEKEINIVPSGNAAIYLSLRIIYDLFSNCSIMVPDEGGWGGFIKYAKMYNFNTIKLKTNNGIINLEELNNLIKSNNNDNNDNNDNIKVLFLTTLAGYLAKHENINEIKKICNENNILFVEDVSGGVGGICGYGDIVVCSTGTPKIINCEYGGFIGISKEIKNKLIENKKLDNFNNLLKTYKTPNIYGAIKEEGLLAKKTYNTYVNYSNILKEELKCEYNDYEGISVFIPIKNGNINEIFREINNNIKLDSGKSLITKCPIYERTFKKGFVVELKKINIANTCENDIYNIANILKNII